MRSLQRVFRIVDLLRDRREIRLQEIADSLRLQKSTAYRLTAELCAEGYLQKSPETKTYALGMKFLDISSHIIDTMDIRALAKPGIRRLNEVTQDTVHLAMLVDRQVIYVDKEESPRAVRMYSQIGKVAPLYCTGVGKAILAFQPSETMDELLARVRFQRYTPNTIVDRHALARELAVTRRRGFALDNEEHEPNVGCIAAPLWDHSQKVIASISITVVLHRHVRIEQLLEYRELLVDTCDGISRKLGFRRETLKDGPLNGQPRSDVRDHRRARIPARKR
ncbi:MAG TPA: IclR family transcriptional regulator [Spirochaetia bacterium]|nr:IclR family transcriptional regulator [Spirochaetia bacterium]